MPARSLFPVVLGGLFAASLFLLGPAHAGMIGTGASPRTVAIGDLNEDGYADLVSGTNTDSSVVVTLGRGNGRFGTKTSYQCGGSVTGVTIADLNGDGHLDVVSCAPSIGRIGIRFGVGDGTLGPRNDIAVTTPTMVVIGDFNEDGIKDLAAASTGAGSPAILLGSGGGVFGAPTYNAGTGGPGVAVGDVNGDGHLDVATTDNAIFPYGVSILLGTGSGTFGPRFLNVMPDQVASVALADLNLDGKLDIVDAVGTSNSVYVKLGNGDGTFTANVGYTTASSPSGIAVSDLNGDGKPDLAVTAANGNAVSVLIGTGTGSFNAKVDYPTGLSPRGIAAGPIDNNGTNDLAIAASGSNSICVLLNNGGGTFPVMAGPVYVWNTNDGSFTDGASWIPTRSTFGANDILVFNRGTTITASNVTTTTLGQIFVSQGTQVGFTGFLTSPTLTVGGGTGDDAVIEEGARLSLPSSGNPVSFALAAGAQAIVYGDLTIAGSSSRFQALSSSGIVFQSTGRATILPGSSTTPFGNGTGASGLNSVNFLYGSQLIAAAPFSIFGATAPNKVVTLGPGSRFRMDTAFSQDVAGRQFGDFEHNAPGASALTGNGTLVMDSLIVDQGTLSVEMTDNVSIRGNIVLPACTGPFGLRFLPSTPALYWFEGNARQYVYSRNADCSPQAIIRMYSSPNVTWEINNDFGVDFQGWWRTASNVHFRHGNIGSSIGWQAALDSSATVTNASQSTGWFEMGVTRRINASGSMRFDIGDSAHYAPFDVDIRGVTKPGYITAENHAWDPYDFGNTQLDQNHHVHRYPWIHATSTIGNIGAPNYFSDMDVTFSWLPSDVDPGSDPLQFVARRLYGPPIPWQAAPVGVRTATSLQVIGVTQAVADSFTLYAFGQPITPSLSVANASSPEGNGGGSPTPVAEVMVAPVFEPSRLEFVDEDGTPFAQAGRRLATKPSLAAAVQPTRTQSAGSLAFRVRLSQSAINPVTVDYQTVDGTATVADNDYTPTSGTLTFAPGDTALDIVVPFGVDSTPEHNETFGLQLSNASSNATIATPSATGTILDDDDLIAPTAQVIYPNGGEVIHQNQQVTLQWTASDNVGVNGVDIQLVNGASVTTLASNYPNTGSYAWTSTGPPSTKMKFRVVAHDDNHATTDNSDANWEISPYTIGTGDDLPVAFALDAPSPNPSATSSNRIAFSVPREAQVRLTIHDVRGRTVAKLVDGALPAGNHTRTWDSSSAAAGVYFVHFEAPGFRADQRLVVVR